MRPSSAPYPVSVRASLDRPSRWLWLVKWLLLVPHYLVLPLLWLSYVVLTGIALIAVFLTERYPRPIFDFNVGVLRWSWRVVYYGYGGLGTDRYPPFSLAPRADYPADLDIRYPERLSRGLVLVKWWLLAVPHYLVLTLLLGGPDLPVPSADAPGGWGLIAVLTVVAGVVLAATGRYPRSVFDLVVGLDRWVIRVAAYASLMTDSYPPFRLDQGGAEPISTRTSDEGAERDHRTWSGLQVGGVIVSSLAMVLSLGLLASGLAARITDATARDADGFIVGVALDLHSDGHAVVSEDVDITVSALDLPQWMLDDVEIQADAGGGTVFVGVARSADVRAYLNGVHHSVVTAVADDGRSASYDVVRGASKPLPPAEADIWMYRASGSGRQTIVIPPGEEDWTVVVMRSHGAAPVDVDLRVGARCTWVDNLAYALLVAGLLVLALGGIGLWLALRRQRSPGAG